jgi:3-deoxy-D-manno-octulosonic-acid transferase
VDPLSLWSYRVLGALALPAALVLPVLRGRFGLRWGDRLGYTLCGGSEPVWIHGASVGETRSAVLLLSALRDLEPDLPATLTSGTPAGLMFLERELERRAAKTKTGPDDRTQIAAPPLDFWGAPGRYLDRLGPRVLVLIETEIWPELIHQCHRRGIGVVMLSARLSERSHRRLRRLKGVFGSVLRQISLIATIGRQDLERFLDLGCDPDKVFAAGSPKFDDLIGQARKNLARFADSDARGREGEKGEKGKNDPAGADGGPPVILAGSTHPGEEAVILRAFGELEPGAARLALAPRHLERVPEALGLVRDLGLVPLLHSEAGTLAAGPNEVVVVDRMGLLADLYRQADVALVGGSFLEGAGHNPLEPAACGVPVVFGPHMSSFQAEARILLDAGAAQQSPPALLGAALSRYLGDPGLAGRSGLSGLKALAALEPAGPVLARILLDFLAAPAPRRDGAFLAGLGKLVPRTADGEARDGRPTVFPSEPAGRRL